MTTTPRTTLRRGGLAERAAWRESGPLRKDYSAAVQRIGKASERRLRFIISTESIDRHGDAVAAAGWDLENFRKNPVVLFGHDYWNPPVTRAENIKVEGGALKADAIFADAET